MPDTPATPPKRRQMNVRLPEDLLERVDARRARKDLSRDQFVERALEYALTHNPEQGPAPLATAPGQRTVRPPRR